MITSDDYSALEQENADLIGALRFAVAGFAAILNESTSQKTVETFAADNLIYLRAIIAVSEDRRVHNSLGCAQFIIENN